MSDEVAEARGVLEQFERLIRDALVGKYSSFPPLLEMNFLLRVDLLGFWDQYLTSGCFPPERLPHLVDLLMDFKLQLYSLLEVDLGLYNRLYHDPINQGADPDKQPHLLFVKLSLDQSLIGKSRVLWERIMNLVYYLEMGHDLETRHSKKGKFLRFAEVSDRWRFLVPYIELVGEFDDLYRTPEYHKSSKLRAALLTGREIPANQLVEPVNRAMKIWQNVLSIICGGKAIVFDDLHELSQENRPRLASMPRPGDSKPTPIDPKYLR